MRIYIAAITSLFGSSDIGWVDEFNPTKTKTFYNKADAEKYIKDSIKESLPPSQKENALLTTDSEKNIWWYINPLDKWPLSDKGYLIEMEVEG